MYGLVFLLVPAGSISQELRTTALAVSLATLVMGNVAFVLYDRALHNMLMMYRLVCGRNFIKLWAGAEPAFVL